MKHVLFFLIFLNTLLSFSQPDKKAEYYFLEFEKISKNEFNNLNGENFFFRTIENDTSIVQNAYFHRSFRKLNATELKLVNELLEGLIGKKFDKKKKSMIHIYSDKKNLYQDVKYQKYWNWIKKNSEKYQSYLIANNKLDVETDENKNIFKVTNNYLTNMFFQGFDFQVNHLLIKPNGEVYIFREMEDILIVLDYSVD